MAFGDADLHVFFEHEDAVSVAYGFQRTRGKRDIGAQNNADGSGLQLGLTTTLLSVATRSLTDLRVDSDITVGGTQYQIRGVFPQDDGKVTIVHIVEV